MFTLWQVTDMYAVQNICPISIHPRSTTCHGRGQLSRGWTDSSRVLVSRKRDQCQLGCFGSGEPCWVELVFLWFWVRSLLWSPRILHLGVSPRPGSRPRVLQLPFSTQMISNTQRNVWLTCWVSGVAIFCFCTWFPRCLHPFPRASAEE